MIVRPNGNSPAAVPLPHFLQRATFHAFRRQKTPPGNGRSFAAASSCGLLQRRGAYNISPQWRQAMVKVCDCFPELKVTTLAREARYRADPQRRAPEGPQSSLEIKVTSTGNLNERIETRNSKQSFVISEPKHVGGLADAPTPLEYLLAGAIG